MTRYDEVRAKYFNVSLTGDLLEDVTRVCETHQATHAYLLPHLLNVANEAKRLAKRFNLDETAAFAGGLLHDIGGLVPEAQRLELAERLGIDVLAAEREVPMLLHGKLSAYFAHAIFGVTAPETLSAITYHTTLHANPTDLEKVVCLADKVKWDREGTPPYLSDLMLCLDDSLNEATKFFIDTLYHSDLLVVHPWLIEAYDFYFDKA
ncbi:MAG: bis(5'-nucleosyl)-tetraphosphatase (symmetrical) YqeK [Streptococcaceae bacterium]|jgi:predicted HD superfamily hydrolase involved in NAD metabolism|nr:bis(5'-nucleosyl)-tetraphosphatase (symmetrical) YqeK [Streptococcaceae bacterium]